MANKRVKIVTWILGIGVSACIILSAGFNAFQVIDTRYAYASRVEKLEYAVEKKKLSDEVFQLKILISQENIFNGGQDTQAVIWMNDQLELKQNELKILLKNGK